MIDEISNKMKNMFFVFIKPGDQKLICGDEKFREKDSFFWRRLRSYETCETKLIVEMCCKS